MATDICYPVLKFSHANGQRSDNTIPWMKLSASDILLLINGSKTSGDDRELTLRLVQGSTVLVDFSGSASSG